jgi:hypothetical protein
MEERPVGSVVRHFEGLQDPRTGNAKAHIFLELPEGIPSDDTFGRVFAKIKPEEFQKRFIEWVQAIEELTAGQVIAVDGKQLRRSHD